MKKIIGRWIFFAVAVPIAIGVINKITARVEESKGRDSAQAKGMRGVRGVVRHAS